MDNIKSIFGKLGLLENADDVSIEAVPQVLKKKDNVQEKDENEILTSGKNIILEEDLFLTNNEDSVMKMDMNTDTLEQFSSTEQEQVENKSDDELDSILAEMAGDADLVSDKLTYQSEDELGDELIIEDMIEEELIASTESIEIIDVGVKEEDEIHHSDAQEIDDILAELESNDDETTLNLETKSNKDEAENYFDEVSNGQTTDVELEGLNEDFSDVDLEIEETNINENDIAENVEYEEVDLDEDVSLQNDVLANSIDISVKDETMNNSQDQQFSIQKSDMLMDFVEENDKGEEKATAVINGGSNQVMPLDREVVLENIEKKIDSMLESYDKNKMLSIDDIYKKALLQKEVKSSIFMVERLSKAMPENLPMDIKKESVLNVMKASDIEVESMLEDAYLRIDALNRVQEGVAKSTAELKRKNEQSIADLEARIIELKRNTQDREIFQDKQNTVIEYEMQRIINILDFIKQK